MTDQMTLKRWFRHKILRKPVDFGGGLTLLPEDPVPSREEAATWADEQWRRWRTHRLSIYSQDPGCPFCQWRESCARDVLFSQQHSDSAARARWARHAKVKAAQLLALGGCECDLMVTEQDARDRAAQKFEGRIP